MTNREHAISEFEKWGKNYEQAKIRIDELVNRLATTVSALKDWPKSVVIDKEDSLGDMLEKVHRSIDASEIPTGQELAKAFKTWARAKVILNNAWRLLDAADRENRPLPDDS